MDNMLLIYLLGCATTASIAPPPPPTIPKPQTTSLYSELTHHVLIAYIIESQGGEFERVEEEWKKAMTYSRCNPEIHLAYGDMAHRYNQIETALSQWERAIVCIAWTDNDRRQQIQQKITKNSNQ